MAQRQIHEANNQPSIIIKFKRKMKINAEENNSGSSFSLHTFPEECRDMQTSQHIRQSNGFLTIEETPV